MSKRQVIKSSFWLKLVSVPILMFGFAFVMIPLYDVLCEVTGLNGRTSAIEREAGFAPDDKRSVNIGFLAYVGNGFPVNFKPEINQIKVIPGKFYTINYIAENTSDEVIVGRAIPSVAPGKAAIHFKKLECFCFEEQTFLPKEVAVMPVRFVIDPELSESVFDISLSYQFFRVNNKGG